ncbi:DUF523 domain-containing protein [Sulfurovum sp. XGS-02]|uniref:DUF523 domain-containing protein n=1 Tax=Sulfurovum sp. XGS-02 TaxID=2925411 RepID=UPI00206C07FE|nr:DUF523 domain-containing protein [Sulfurovum sp. XGS-02]UPT77788.1 DUF523 domain-containing protein [Sulfurovum sp. XGS-02]
MMKKVAISACLLGEKCRYDATDNKDEALLKKLQGMELIPFCPEDFAFGTPRPTMDLIRTKEGDRALSNVSGEDLSAPVIAYATAFFENHPELELFIGKDRSPSCGVCSARVYDEDKNLLSENASGLMAKEAIKRKIHCIDAEEF